MDNGTRYACIVWARRHGKDLTCWNYAIKTAALQPMDVTYVYPTADMAKNNLWEAKTNDGVPFLDYVPLEIRKRQNKTDDGLNNTSKQVTLWNGSIIRLMSGENPGRLRGANSKLYVLSEYAEMSPEVFDIIEPVVEANHGQIIVNFTPKGDNHAAGAWKAWQEDKMWFTQLITAKDTQVFTPEQLDRILASTIRRFTDQGRGEEEARIYFEQEYMCNFDSPVVGSYYGAAIRKAIEEKRITSVPVEATIPVHTAWDLGVGDSTAIWFYQNVGLEVHVVDYYETSGEGLTHYIRVLKDKGYVYGNHYAPHDIEVRELSSGKSRLETARSLGINFRIVPSLSLEDGIEASRNIFNKCWFDKEKCKRGIDALKSYHKEFDDKNKTYKEHPEHDWSSHGADSFRYFAVSYKKDQAPFVPPKYVPSDNVIGV